MTETRRDRLAGDGELDGAAETASLVDLAHVLSFARTHLIAREGPIARVIYRVRLGKLNL